MYEDYMRKRTNLHSTHTSQNQPQKKHRIGITGFQIIICLICIAVTLVVKLIGGSTYTYVKSNISKAINKPVTSSDVQGVFATIKSNLPDVSEIFSSSSVSKNSSGSGSSGSSSSSGTSSQNASGSSSASSSGTSSSSSSSAASGSSSSK